MRSSTRSSTRSDRDRARRRALTSVALAAGFLLLPDGARGDDADAGVGATLRAQVSAALDAEAEADPERALAAWRAVALAAPTSRDASRARRRIAWIEERSGTGWSGLAALMRGQSAPPEERTTGFVEALAREADALPPGRARIELRALIAGEWLRLGENERAIEAYRVAAEEPGARESERRMAEEGHARALVASGRAPEAMRTLEDAGLGGGSVHAELARARRRAVAVPIAWAAIALFAVLAVVLAAPGLRAGPGRVLRRALGPARMLAGAWVLLAPLAIASAYDHEASDTFSLLAAGLAPVLALASIAGSAARAHGARRIALATATVLAVLAVGYLVGDRAGPLLSFFT